MKKTQWVEKTRRVASDDLVVNKGDEEVKPHQGEHVTFRQRFTLADTRMIFKLMSLRDADPTNPAIAREFDDLFGRACERLAENITEWDWTGPDGETLPSPTPDVIESLTNDEFYWLLNQYQAPSEVPKN